MSLSSSRGMIVVDHAHAKEFFDADDKILNNIQGILEEQDFRYTTQASIYSMFHVNVIRNQLTQHIASMMPDIIDELTAVLGEDLDLLVQDGRRIHSMRTLIVDWTSFVVYQKSLKIVSRISQRVFVGFPLCIFSSCSRKSEGRSE